MYLNPGHLNDAHYHKLYKTNSTARVFSDEENFPRTFAASAIVYSKYMTRNCLTLTMKIKVTEHNDPIVAI